jgi:catechol 2,3-dioxygenase-like lactoylglutathione lyase family enzyme
MKQPQRASLLALLGTWVLAAQAHHSPAIFDQSREIQISGTVTEFVWANPHSWIHLDVATGDGSLERWSVEMNPPTYLVRGGWRSNTIKPGDRVTVVVHPLRNDEPAGQYVSITLPDGRVLGEQPAVLGENTKASNSVAPVMWAPFMNVFRRFDVAPAKMYAFYGDVLGLQPLQTIDLANGTGVARFQAGAGTSELKFTARVADRTYQPGGVKNATGLRLISLYFSDSDGLSERFAANGLTAPVFRSYGDPQVKRALVQDPDGQPVELVVVTNATEDTLKRIDVGLTVSDVERSRSYYRDFVGLEELAPEHDPLFDTTIYPYRNGSTTVNLRFFGPDLPADTGSGGIQYIVTDADRVNTLAAEQHIEVDQPLSELAGFSLRTIWLDDPDGITNYFAETAAARASRNSGK